MVDEQTKPRPELSDLDLIRRVRIEDVSAYEQLVRRYYSRIYSLVYGMLSHRRNAENVTSEVFVKAWSARGHFAESMGLSIWLYRIAFNRALKCCKKQKRRRATDFEEFDAKVKQSESYKKLSQKGAVLRKISLREFQKKMHDALITLSDRHRATLILHDIHGLSPLEIASVMNGSEGPAADRVARSKKKVQSHFEVSEEDTVRLIALKKYEHPDSARIEKNIEKTMHAVRAAHKRPSLHHFPDKSTAWMFAQPRYGIAALFIIFLALVLLERPLPVAQPAGNTSLSIDSAAEDALDGLTNQTETVFSGIAPAVRPIDMDVNSFTVPKK